MKIQNNFSSLSASIDTLNQKNPPSFFCIDASIEQQNKMKQAFIEHLSFEVRKHAKKMIEQIKKMHREGQS